MAVFRAINKSACGLGGSNEQHIEVLMNPNNAVSHCNIFIYNMVFHKAHQLQR